MAVLSNLSMATLSFTFYLVSISFLLACLFSGSTGELQRFEHPVKESGSLNFLVLGDWGRQGLYNQSHVAHQAAADVSAIASSGPSAAKILPYKLVDPQKMGWEERARIYGFNSSLFSLKSLGRKILSPELLADQRCSDRRLIVSAEQLGAGLPVPLYNPSNPLFYMIYSEIDPPCGVMQLNGNSIQVISEWVARSEGRSYYYKKLPKELRHPPEYWTVERFFKCYKVEKSLSKEKAPWSVSLGKIADSFNPLSDVDLSGSKKNTLLRHSSDEVWFTKPVLIEGPVLYGYEDEEKRVERKKFEAHHNLPIVNFYSIFFSEKERTKSQEKIAQAKKKKADKAKAKSQEASDENDAPKKRKRSSESAPAEKGEINQSDVLIGDENTAGLSLPEPNRKKMKTMATKRKGVRATSSTTEAVTQRRTRRFTVYSDEEETEDDRTPKGENLSRRVAAMPNSRTLVPSRGCSSLDGEASHSDQPEMNLNQYGSNIGTPLGFFASGASVPSVPGAPANDLSGLLRAHSVDPRKHPLDPSVSGFLAQVFSGSLDKNSVTSVAAYHQSFAEAQKYLGKFLFDLADARGLEAARLGEDIRLLKQEKKNLVKDVKGLKDRLEIAVSERDTFKQDADVQRERATKFYEELRSALNLCDKKNVKISSLEDYIEGEGDRAALFIRDHARFLCRSMGIQPPYYHDGLEDPDAVLESDKDLISTTEAEFIISELRKVRLAENVQATNDDAEGHEATNLEREADDGVDSRELGMVDESISEEPEGDKGGDGSTKVDNELSGDEPEEMECIDASGKSSEVTAEVLHLFENDSDPAALPRENL